MTYLQIAEATRQELEAFIGSEPNAIFYDYMLRRAATDKAYGPHDWNAPVYNVFD